MKLSGELHALTAPNLLYDPLLYSVYLNLLRKRMALLMATGYSTFPLTPIVSLKASVPTLALHISVPFLTYFTYLS